MDDDQLSYFTSRYRNSADEDLLAAAAGIDRLSPEAQEALRKVLRERELSPITATSTQAKASSASEKTSPPLDAARIAVIAGRKHYFMWSLPILFVSLLIIRTFGPGVQGTPLAPLAGLIGIGAVSWYLYCSFKLSLAVDRDKGTAWMLVALHLLLPVGLIVAASLAWKATKLTRPE